MPTLQTKNYREFSVVDDSGTVLKTFSGAKNACKCLPGDSVDLTDTGCKLVSRTSQPTIAGLLELSSKIRFGFSGRNVPIYQFIPFNESYPPFVVGCSEKDCSVNRLALIRFEGQWDDGFPRGLLQRLLPVGADEEALFWTYSPLACEKYKGAELPIATATASACDSRIVLPVVDTFHIDPVGCKDVDDVLTFGSEGGRDYVVITIADVASSIEEGHPLDMRASLICQTLYQDGVEPKHMFPAALSEERLSLLSGRKPGLSLRVCLDDLACNWFESVVEVGKSFTYESVYDDAELCVKLRRMGIAFGLVCSELADSHKWIEAAMKFYNIQAASRLKAAGVGVLRIHKAPDAAKLEELVKLDPQLGFLAMNSATYVSGPYTEDVSHWGLSEGAYTHATSPIRRYADLINQRCLKALGRAEVMVWALTVDTRQLNSVAKLAKQHDRDLVFLRAIKRIGTGTGSVKGRLIALRDIDAEESVKLSLFVPDWGLVVKIVYKKGSSSGTVVSKDETVTHTVCLGTEYELSYRADLRARCWKRRMILRLV